MIPWILTYVAIVIVGFMLGFGPWVQRPKRRIIRVVAVILALPLGIIGGLIVLLTLVFYEAEPPGLTDLAHQFSSKRADLETILKMSNEDRQYSRIAPSFVDLGAGRYMADDPGSQLTKARWDEYRRIYERNGIKLGIQRDTAGDAFIMVDSIGLLNRGHTTGYLFCVSSTSVDANRFYPCPLHQQDGQRRFNPEKHEEAYAFHKLDDRWYAYDEGPS